MSKQQFKSGPRAKFRSQEFWAEGGCICIENQNDGDFKVITRAEAAARAYAFNEELKRCTYPSDRDELCKCVVALAEAVKEAKRQGDPDDPEVRKQRIKDARKVSLVLGANPSPKNLIKEAGLEDSRFDGYIVGRDRFRDLRL